MIIVYLGDVWPLVGVIMIWFIRWTKIRKISLTFSSLSQTRFVCFQPHFPQSQPDQVCLLPASLSPVSAKPGCLLPASLSPVSARPGLSASSLTFPSLSQTRVVCFQPHFPQSQPDQVCLPPAPLSPVLLFVLFRC